MRFAPVFGIGWVGIWLCASPASLQVKPPIEELFRGSEGVRLSVQIDLPQAQLTSEEARDYCLRELTALGVPIVDEKPDDLREADVPLQQRQVKEVPELRISIGGGPVPASELAISRGVAQWYESRISIQYWDFVAYRRNPAVEKLMPIIFYNATGTFYSADDFERFVTSRDGIEGALDSSIARFKRSLYGEWSFDPFSQPLKQ